MKFMGVIAALVLSVLPADESVARADYHRRGDPYNRYVTISAVPENRRAKVEAAIKFAIPSASRNTLLDRQIPERVGGSSVFRINLNDLDWDWKVYAKVTERDPYYRAYNGLLARGDWLLHELADTTESQSYYELLYKVPPKSRDEFLKIWGVDQAQQKGLELGWCETQSQVSKQGTRFIRRFLSNRGAVWVTQDVLKLERSTDPLEFPDGQFKHDGEESIALTPKVSTRLKTRGSAMAFLLSNGQGKRVEEAPVDLVDDSFKTIRSQSAIINNGSCIGCHTGGLNPPSVNGIESLLLQGVQFYSKDKEKQEFAERFHLATKGLETEIKRANEDFAVFVLACNGLTPQQNAAGYREALRDYESDLTLDRAAHELGATEAELRNALAYATAARIDLGPRFSVLAHGQPIGRTLFEESYQKAASLLRAWRDDR